MENKSIFNRNSRLLDVLGMTVVYGTALLIICLQLRRLFL